MAKVIEIDRKHVTGIRDSNTGQLCEMEKAVDITEDCPVASEGTCRIILFFTRVKRGRIVEIARPYEGEAYMGVHIHFFVDELDRHVQAVSPNDTFGKWAEELGLSKLALRSLIEAQAPAA